MIKNLIFDVGGVLLEYRCIEMLMDYGLSREEAELLGDRIFDDTFWADRMDRGLLSIEDATSELGTLYPEYADAIAWFLRNGEQMVIPHPEIWEKVAALKRRGYRIYILSNYSEKLFKIHTEKAASLEMIDGGVISYQVHQIKPEREIYLSLLQKYDLRAEECLFYDDREINVEAARQLGMQAVWVRSIESVTGLLEQIC